MKLFRKKKLEKIEARMMYVEEVINHLEWMNHEVNEAKLKLFRIAKSDDDEEVEAQIRALEENLHNMNCYILGNLVRLQNEWDTLREERHKLH